MHTALGLPGPADEDPEHYLLAKDEYVVSYNSHRKNANWVAWQLDGLYFAGGTRTRTWRSDQQLPAGTPQAMDKDYTNSGFDRGHMCPSGDRTRMELANKVTFTLTNALPQVHNVNGGPWQDLEEYLHGLAIDGHEMYVVAGGIYDAAPQTIGRDVHVPSATWKVAVVLDHIGDAALQVRTSTRVIAVLTVNDDMSIAIGEDWKNHRVRVRDIEALTGLDFLSDLDRELQDVLEEHVDAD
jgi:endonuclease G